VSAETKVPCMPAIPPQLHLTHCTVDTILRAYDNSKGAEQNPINIVQCLKICEFPDINILLDNFSCQFSVVTIICTLQTVLQIDIILPLWNTLPDEQIFIFSNNCAHDLLHLELICSIESRGCIIGRLQQ